MPKNPTIFLIDDDTDDQEIFSLALSRANESAKCVVADDGIDAIEKFNKDQDFHPDFIFIDMNMPRMNGTQCLAEIKRIDRLKDIPVFIYSTSSDPTSIEENKILGAEDFIVKPADINILTRMLAQILKRRAATLLTMLFLIAAFPRQSYSQQPADSSKKVIELKKLSVEDLMNITVTSVSKTPENIGEVASAIQVITGDEIRRSTAFIVPEALRLATNLNVSQSGAHDWGISARGFNGYPVANTTLSNKLLVLIDGRSAYTQLFGGVFWDVQNVMLEDLDRIEVISGPGGTIWGANAVNGVVNIISKNAKETPGVYASGSVGTFLQDHFSFRYGSHIDTTFYFRVYGQRFDGDNSTINDIDAKDGWSMNQGGFRADFMPDQKNNYSLQGDYYSGTEDDTSHTKVDGQNAIFKWEHRVSSRSSFKFKYYIDRTFRNISGAGNSDEMLTNDFELQHNIALGTRHKIVWGGDYRIAHDDAKTSDDSYRPEKKILTLFSAFVQDQITLVPQKIELTLGMKVLHNNYTNLEYHPTIRLAFTPDYKNTIWVAVSQSVRTPTRFEVDNHSLTVGAFGDFKSEKVISYEAGWHFHPISKLSASLSMYYNDYRDLRSVDSTKSINPPYFTWENHLESNTYGLEISANYDLTNWWKLRGGISLLHESFETTSPLTYPTTYRLEAIDPERWYSIQSIMNIGQHIQFDLILRYVDNLPEALALPAIDEYYSAGIRLGYQYKWLTVSIYGKNLLQENHVESGLHEIPRSYVGKISVSF